MEESIVDEYIRSGELEKAQEKLKEIIRSRPDEAKYRVSLFQLLSALGHWSRALTQLNVAAELDQDNVLMAKVCRYALNCEALRSEIFAGRRTPLVFGDPEEWVGHLIQALQLLAKGEDKPAQRLRAQAFEAAAATAGTIDGEEFQWIADADGRLGPILEAIINGRYFWVPFANIATLEIDKAADLRDMVWIPARFKWPNGGEAVGLIPTRYPGSETNNDSAFQLARRTEWISKDEDLYIGLGQRMFATDKGEYPLLETRKIIFKH